jgi:hypothetical protein
MFKIAVGTNLFGSCPRQDLGIQSLLKCKKILGDQIDLFNIQFANGKDLTEHDEIKTLKCLTKTSNDICGGKRELPIVREIFDKLADLGYDYFCFVNSDIIVTPNFFKEILKEEHEAYIASRLAIEGDIRDLNFSISINDTKSKIKNSHYQVSGFDAFTIKTKWWKENRLLFPEYVFAVVYWDTHYATLLLKNADTFMQNKKPTLFHIIHEDKSSSQCVEFFYNQDTFSKKYTEDFNLWHRFLFEVLLKRGIHNNYVFPLSNEIELQQLYFKKYNI